MKKSESSAVDYISSLRRNLSLQEANYRIGIEFLGVPMVNGTAFSIRENGHFYMVSARYNQLFISKVQKKKVVKKMIELKYPKNKINYRKFAINSRIDLLIKMHKDNQKLKETLLFVKDKKNDIALEFDNVSQHFKSIALPLLEDHTELTETLNFKADNSLDRLIECLDNEEYKKALTKTIVRNHIKEFRIQSKIKPIIKRL